MTDKNYPLVSIMVPVFNGEAYVGRCLESVLNQDYKNIELVIVDDGSTDKTKDIIFSFDVAFQKEGMKLIYIHQNNQGQAKAIDTALKTITGQYVAWFDSDDILLPNFIDDLLKPLLNNENKYSIGKLAFVSETDTNKIISIRERIPPKENDNFFFDLIKENNILYGNGTVLVKTAYLFSKLKDRSIFISPEGQNWQLMLPITYKEKCSYVEKIVSKQVQRDGSHSRQVRSYNDWINRFDGFNLLLKETINRMDYCPISERKLLFKYINEKYNKIKFQLAFDNNNKNDANQAYIALSEESKNDKLIKRQHALLCEKRTRIGYTIYNLKRKVIYYLSAIKNKLFK